MGGGDLRAFREEFERLNKLLQQARDDDAAALFEVREFMMRRAPRLTPEVAMGISDWYYIEGMSLAEIADRLNTWVQVVQPLIVKHGPTEYVALRLTDSGEREMRRVPAERSVARRKEIAALRSQGWRFAPARWRVNPDTADPNELWERFGASRSA